jgi:hypothetical protein
MVCPQRLMLGEGATVACFAHAFEYDAGARQWLEATQPTGGSTAARHAGVANSSPLG